jgi:hypothetical protein
MAVNPLMTIGVTAIQQGLKGMTKAAQDVAELNIGETSDDRAAAQSARDGDAVPPARADDGRSEAVDALTDLRLHARKVQLASRVVETADEVLGFLIDVRA